MAKRSRSSAPLRILTVLTLSVTVGFLAVWTCRTREYADSRGRGEQTHREAPARFNKDTGQRHPTLPPPDSDRPFPEGAIADELILSFDSEDTLRAFLDQSEDGSYQVLSYNPKIRAVRLRIRNADDAANLRERYGKTDFNYTVLTPFPVAPPTGGFDWAFDNRALAFMRVPHANDQAGRGIRIAVIDSGIRPHTTLAGVSLESIDLVGTAPSESFISHGTAVASLIAGQDGNGIAPAADLLSIRVLDADGIGDAFSLAEGIVRAVDERAQIINMSVATYGTNAALEAAVAYATAHEAVLVASAGNDGLAALPYPAAYAEVISVSAVDAKGYPTTFANQSADIDISAPGVGVFAAWEEENWVSFTGTSASAPFVSGAIAALASRLPDTSPQEAAAILLANANDTGLPGADPQTGAGYLDVQRSLDSRTRYRDAALASIYLSPEVNPNGSQTLYLSAQNRGTEPLPSANIEFTLPNGVTQSVYLGSLEPNQSASHQLNVTQSELGSPNGFRVQARVVASEEADAVPENDAKQVTLLPSP